jgi:hypothetical protein
LSAFDISIGGLLSKVNNQGSGRSLAAVREVYLLLGADNADALRLPPKYLAEREADYVTEVQLPVAAAFPPASRQSGSP